MNLLQTIIMLLTTLVTTGAATQSYATEVTVKPVPQVTVVTVKQKQRPAVRHHIKPHHKAHHKAVHKAHHKTAAHKAHHKAPHKRLSKRQQAFAKLSKACRNERKAIHRFIKDPTERKQALQDNKHGCKQARQALRNKFSKRKHS